VKPKSRKKRYLPAVATGLGVAILGVIAVMFIRNIVTSAKPQTKKVVQEIHVIRPPPPPPDQPPPPPPPPEEKVNVPDPEQKPDPTPSNDPPPSEQLGLDAEGSAGGDAFGLVGNKGGRDLVGGPGGSVFTWYTGLVGREISDLLGAEKKVRNGNYSTSLKLWVRRDGSVDHVTIARSSGDRERDKAIEAAVLKYRLSQPPPADLPNPVSLNITSHG
jgi:periplasmic protein TonB